MNDVKISASALKDRFKSRSVPDEEDFYHLIEMANIGQKAAGQSSEQSQLSQNTGLELDTDARLKVKRANNSALNVNENGVSLVIDETKGLKIENNALIVKAGAGLQYNTQTGHEGVIEAKCPDNGGLQVTQNGLSVKAGKGITVDKNGVAFNFSDAMPAGTILMWNNSASSIPAGWAVCDGTHGTPDLRGRFILGGDEQSKGGHNNSGSQNINNANKNSLSYSLSTDSSDTNIYANVQDTILTIDNMPSHSHTGGAQWAQAGSESPQISNGFPHPVPVFAQYGVKEVSGGGIVAVISESLDCGFSGKYELYYTSREGGGLPHNHSATAYSLPHSHSVNISVPYYILIFIMKIN